MINDEKVLKLQTQEECFTEMCKAHHHIYGYILNTNPIQKELADMILVLSRQMFLMVKGGS